MEGLDVTVTGDDALVGRVLDGRYLVESRIARGGMASVFLAIDQRLDRAVALKVMHADLGGDTDDEFIHRFVSEARSAAKLNHRNVVSVFDQGRDGDVVYLVMEYVDGLTLRDVMRHEAPMSPLRVLTIIEQVLTALSAAHAANIIHRDVKPENVLITTDGEVKVADFGLARAVSAATTAVGGTLIGTVSYLAPEIVLHEGADARCDVYAVGAMMYEMLTGMKPHTGDSPIQVAYKHVHEDIGPPSARIAGIPDYVDALVARATVRDRDWRSADARVFGQQARSVRQALQAGVTSDRALVEDLLPASRMAVDSTEPTAPVLLGAQDTTAAADAVTIAVGASESVEPTVSWHSPAADTAQQTGTPAQAVTPSSVENGVSPRTATGIHPAVTPQDYRAVQPAGRTTRRGKLLLAAVLVTALILGFAGWWFADGRYVDAPALVGSAEAQAKAQAERAGFTFEVAERRYSETVAAGVVIATDPKPGGRILPDGTIEAVISKGKDRVTIPDNLAGMSVDDASAALEKVDLAVGDTIEKYHDKVPAERVIGAASIKADEPLKRGTIVDIAVSKGPQPVEITDRTGKPFADAKVAAEGAGLVVSATETFSDDVENGLIIRQDPTSGTLYRGDTIRYVVSKGPDVVSVPNVVGKRRNEAGRILRDAGFKVAVLALPGNWTVRAQSPANGRKAKRGSSVAISPIGF